MKLIGDLRSGEGGYTVFWALGYDAEDRLVVYLDYLVHTRPGGTVSTPIFRVDGGFMILRETFEEIDSNLARWNRAVWGYGSYGSSITVINHPERFARVRIVDRDHLRQRLPNIEEPHT